MRKKASNEPKRRGAPPKSRLNYRRLLREWLVFKRNNPSLTQELAARKFLRVRQHWIEEDLGLLVGGYTRLRNASADGKRERERVLTKRGRDWHKVDRIAPDLRGKPRLSTPIQEAQEAYLLIGIGSDISLAAGRG
jgi:hypothetical protein